MNEQEQIQWLWEQCGLRYQEYLPSFGNIPAVVEGWYAPDGGWLDEEPLVDLNNLFKYAVPKLLYFELKKKDHWYTAGARMPLGNTYYEVSNKPEDASFVAIYKALGGA